MKVRLSAAAAVVVCLASQSAMAAKGQIPFNATVLGTCIIFVGQPGTMTASADYTELNSKGAGGASGSATILTTNGNYHMSTTTPSAFSAAPGGGNDSVTFTSSYSASGATSLRDVLGTVNSLLGRGFTNVEVDLKATKSAGATFPAGNYSAEVTLTCE
jgi:hypothetical protein